MKWQIQAAGRFYDANEGASVIYFDPGSGDTHLLSDFSAYVVEQLVASPLSTEELADQIAPQIEIADGTELTNALLDVLDELVALDILQRL